MIEVPISPGELLDKVSILKIKTERIGNATKVANVQKELNALEEVRDRCISSSDDLTKLVDKLKEVNESLWDIEDAIREEERRAKFGGTFVSLARSVYIKNDERCAIKRSINELLNSGIIEEKSYQKY